MPFLRSLVLRALPQRWRADAERDSRLWRTECTGCGHISNVWELGGLRWRAVGQPLTAMRCAGCGKVRMQRISRGPKG